MKLLKIMTAILLFLSITASCSAAPPSVTPSNQPNLPAQPEKPQTTSLPVETLPAYPLTVTDDLGRTVVVKKLPQRIVSLAPSITETLFALGLDEAIVGVTDYCDYPEAAKTKPRVSSYTTPNFEKLVSIQPDLIFAESIHEKTVLPALEKLGFTIVVFSATSINSVINDIALAGKIMGKSQKASALNTELTGKIEAITAKTKNLDAQSRPRLLYVVWHQPIWTMGSKTYTNDLFWAAGANNIFASEFEKSRIVSLESVISANPQVIIVTGMGTSGDQIYAGIKDEPRLKVTDAIKNNRIYKISDANLIERPGPRIVDGLQELSKLIHPEIFGSIK